MKRLTVLVTLVFVAAACGTADDSASTSPSTAATTEVTVPTSTVPTSATTGTPATTTTTEPLPSVPTLATTTTSLAPPPEAWGGLDIDPSIFDGFTLVDGVMAGHRSVVSGCARQGEAPAGFPVWWSDDLTVWRQATAPVSAWCVSQVEASDFGLYALIRGEAGLLHSLDGSEWTSVPIHQLLGYEEAWELGPVFGVFVAPDGGRVTALFSFASESESRIATLATTTDGEAWEQGPAESAALFDSSDVAAVVEGGPGLVAVGTSPGGEFVPTGAVFTSPEGLFWARTTPFSTDFDDTVMLDVLAFDDRFVSVGGDFFRTGEMVAWTSDDGAEWLRSPSPGEEVDPSTAHLTADTLTVASGWIWASGVDFDARRGDAGLPALWRSADGTRWERVDLDSLEAAIPFVILETPDLRLGVWPPPNSLLEVPLQLFAAD